MEETAFFVLAIIVALVGVAAGWALIFKPSEDDGKRFAHTLFVFSGIFAMVYLALHS